MERTNVFTMDLLEDDVNSLLSQYDTKENKHTGMNHTDQELYKFLMDEEDPRDKSFRPTYDYDIYSEADNENNELLDKINQLSTMVAVMKNQQTIMYQSILNINSMVISLSKKMPDGR